MEAVAQMRRVSVAHASGERDVVLDHCVRLIGDRNAAEAGDRFRPDRAEGYWRSVHGAIWSAVPVAKSGGHTGVSFPPCTCRTTTGWRFCPFGPNEIGPKAVFMRRALRASRIASGSSFCARSMAATTTLRAT